MRTILSFSFRPSFSRGAARSRLHVGGADPGKDRQLDAAVAELLKQIASRGAQKAER